MMKPLTSGSLRHGPPGWICGFFLLCGWASIAAGAEPSHNGRLLSEWLADERASTGVTLVGAPYPPRDAVRAMGTNAIPPLLQWISYERSLSDKFPRASEVPHWRWHALNPEELADTAPSAFGSLGAVARPAIPQLTRLARTSSDSERANRCALSLAFIGPESIPCLASLATNGPPWTRYWAVNALEYFACTPEAVQTVPVLIQCLADTDTYPSVVGPAGRCLINMEPAIAIPALTNALQSSSAQARLQTLACLTMFARDSRTNVPPTVVPALRGAMRDPSYEIRDMATNTLRRMGDWGGRNAN